MGRKPWRAVSGEFRGGPFRVPPNLPCPLSRVVFYKLLLSPTSRVRGGNCGGQGQVSLGGGLFRVPPNLPCPL